MSGSIRIIDMPDLGAPTDASSVVGEKSGSGRFGMPAINSYLGGRFLPLAGGTVTGPVNLVPGLPGENQLQIDFTESSPEGPFGSALVITRAYDFTGGGSDIGAGSFDAVVSPLIVRSVLTQAPEMFVWNFRSEMYLNTTGTSSGQHVGISSNVFRNSGATPAFMYHGQHIDFTGLQNGYATIVGMELDIRANGPEPEVSGTNPQFGGRTYIELDSTTNQPDAWKPSTAYAAGAAVQPTTPNGFTYVCMVAGTSGTSQPVWPLAEGVVSDGGVTWQYGTTIAMQVSRAINIGGEMIDGQPSVSYGAGIITSAAFYDAILEFTFAHLVDGGLKDAAIRLASNMPIDFSGDAGQNLHILQFTNGVGLQYISSGTGEPPGTVLLQIEDDFGGVVTMSGPLNVGGQGIAYSASLGADFVNRIAFGWDGSSSPGNLLFTVNGFVAGNLQMEGDQIYFTGLPTDAPNDAGAAGAGVPVGGVYRDGSALMVRVT